LSHVLTDCPHREKLGWLEVAHLMSNSIAYNFDIQHMYTGLVEHMKDCIQPNGLVPNTAPEYAEFPHDFRDSPEWGSSAVILPWFLYKWYGDMNVLEDSYPMMAAYTDYLTSRSDGHLLFHGLGDWYDLGPGHPGYSQLTERGLTPTAIYYHDLTIMEQTARLLGKDEDAARYAVLAGEVKKAFNDRFFNKEKGYYDKGSQTANAMPIYLGLVDEEYKDGCLNQIVEDIQSRGNSITSGDIGFSYLLRTLLQEGESELVYDMNSQSDRPGYGYQLKQGATSLTESWEALKTSSHNHCMLGHLMEWLYGAIGGIRPNAESVAFKEFIINPEPVGDITSASVSFRSPYGMITNEWKIEDGIFRENVTVPVGTRATISLPASSIENISVDGYPIIGQPHITYIGQEKGKYVFGIESGTYDIKVADYMLYRSADHKNPIIPPF
ncbi:MAG: alpha-L-rhamnosidase, partial [Muribaculaceae bacterium]|nr:alpha-L-rhamnosidase [Muribaculaceae bacterium]